MGFWDKYEEDRKKKEEEQKAEEEKAIAEQKKEDRARDSLSFWEQMEYDRLTGNRSAAPNDEEVTALTEPDKLIGKLADRGVTIQLPEPEKEPVIDERPTLVEALGSGRGTTSFTDRLRNTAGARKTEQDALAALEEETHRNETVRNQEWLDALRSEEEIQKDLDAAKKETGAAKRKDFWEGLKGDLKYLFGGVNEDERGQEDFNRYQKENAEKIQALKDELSERKWADYERLRNNEDFEENSQYQSTKNWEKAKKDAMGRYTSTGYDDLEYEYVNGTAGVGDILESQKQEAGVGQGLSGQLLTPKEYEYEQWSEMTDDERSLYNYIYKTQSPEDAHEYLEFLRSDLYARQAEKEKARAAAHAEAHPVESTLATVGLSPLKGLAYAGQARDYLSTGEIDENAPYNRIAYLPAAEREAVTKQIEQNWGEIGSLAYSTGVSMLEFVLNSFVTGSRFLNPETDLGKLAEWASLMVMGTGAAADATISAKERGLDDDQAFWLGTVAGTAEVITEKVSIEALFSNPWEKTNLAKWLQDALYVGQNFGAEFSEETASDAINWTVDVLIAQDKSEWRQAINRYMTEDHMSEQDAFLAALKDKGWDIIKSGLGGGFSGGFMAGSNVAYRNIAQGAQESYDRSQDIEAARSATQAVRNLGQEKPNVMAGIEQAQQQAAQPEGIVLPTAEEAARTEEKGSGDTLRFGTEPETKTLTPTVEEAETNAAVEKAEAEGNITRATGIRYGVKEKLIRTMERLGEITGHRVHFFAGALKNGKVVNGYTDKATGDIYINTKAKQPALFTFAHEFTHNLEGTDAYKALMDHIKTRAAETGTDWLAKRADMRQLYERGTGQQVDDAYVDEEILADWIGDNLSDEKTIREICRENPSAAKRIHDALDSFIIRAANAGGIMTDYEVRKYRNVVGMIEKYIGQANQNLERNAREARETVQTGTETVQTAQAAEGAEGNETPAEYLARMGELYDAGEISEEDYEAAQDLAAEMESTGRSFERSTVERDEGPRGKIAEAIDRVRGRYSFSEATEEEARHKQDQYELIERVNPAKDDSHTWIRSVNDILTFREALESDGVLEGGDLAPDWTEEKIKEALKNGTVTIYSSKPIQAGTFVTPSRMEAQNYAGKWKVYQRNVPVRDVAWIDGNQGQYAPGRKEKFTYDRLTKKEDIRAIDLALPAGAASGNTLTKETVKKEALKNVRAKNNPLNTPESAFAYNRDSEKNLLVNTHSVEHGIRRGNQLNMLAAMHIGDLLENAIQINSHDPRNGNLDGGVYLAAGYVGDDLIICRFVTNNNEVKDYEVVSAMTSAKKDSAAVSDLNEVLPGSTNVTESFGDGSRLTAGSLPIPGVYSSPSSNGIVSQDEEEVKPYKTISVSRLLDHAKDHFADVLPKEVLDHYGMERPASPISGDIRYSISPEEPEIRYSLVNTSSGPVAVLDEDITKNKPQDMTYTDYIEQYLADAFSEDKFLGSLPESGMKVYASDELPTEFTGSTYTKYLRNRKQDRFYAKMKAATSLDEMVEIATGRKWEKAKHEHNKDAKYGVYKYNTRFAFPVKDAAGKTVLYRAYTCDLVILNGSDGNKYLYDIQNIKEDTTTADELSQRETRKGLHESQLRSAFSNIVSQGGADVNGGEERFSLSPAEIEQRNEEYMRAVDAGDTETQQRMVDEAAEMAGYTRRMWHGAKNGKTFTTFRGWSYFTEDRAFAEKYTNRDPENLYGVYAKVEHPFDTRTDRKARRIFEEARREHGFTQLGDSGLPDWTDGYDLADYIDENELDYDGILLDEGEQYVPNARGELEPRGRVVSYVIKDSAQIKSADPVTYDDEGNVIPLSERFNPEEVDIRYSLAEDEAAEIKNEEERIYTEGGTSTRFSLASDDASEKERRLDVNYISAVLDGDEAEERRILKDAAAQRGYTDEAYHGTEAFGFTRIDVSKSDDEMSFFVTTDLDTAKTYTEKGGVREIGRKSDEAEKEFRKTIAESVDSLADVVAKVGGITKGMARDFFAGIEDSIINHRYKGPDGAAMMHQAIIHEIEEFFYDHIYEPKGRFTYDGDFVEEDSDLAYDEWIDSDDFGKIYEKIGRLEDEAIKYDPNGGIYHVFVNPDGILEVQGNGAPWHHIPYTIGPVSGTGSTRQISQYAKDLGYKGVVFRNIVDDGGRGRDRSRAADVYNLFYPEEQVKSADLVTYDDDGRIILPSKRYDPRENDMRWSLSEGQEEQGTQNDLAGLSQKAKSAALRIEQQLTMDVAQAIQRDLKPDPKDPEFRQFRAEVARPVIEALLRGEDADPDAVLESTGIDIVGQAAARGAVNDALRRASGKIGRIRTAVQQSNVQQQARDKRNAEIDARIPDTTAGLVDLANTVKAARNRWNSIRGRTIMTEEDLALAHQLATGQITEGEAFAQNAFGMDDIVNMAEAEREFLDANAPWERYTKRLMQGRFEEADGYLQNADQAKDKASGFQYDRETPERNFRDVFGSDAAAMIDKYIRPVHTAEAASTRMKNEYNKRVKALKLSQKVGRGNTNSEAAAVQFLGEAEDNIRVLELARNYNAVRDGRTLEEWRNAVQEFVNANPNLDYAKVHSGIEEFQQIYKELITRMNEVLVENGYMPVNVRRGYFPHFNGGSDGVLATFAHLLGINIDTNALPTAINGLTSMFKPGKPWFSHAMERTGFQTDYDALQGFDGYLGGVSDVIHQTPNIRNLRTLASRIRYRFGDEGIKDQVNTINAREDLDENQKQVLIDDLNKKGQYKLSNFVAWLDEYTNLLANKKSKLDRGIEDLMGRRFYTWMKNIEGRVAANMISGNLGSALTNFIPLNQAGAVLGDPAMLRGAFDTMAGRARGDGFAERSDFLTNRRGTDPLLMNTAEKISEFLSKPMNLIDDFTSETIVRAAYNKYRKQGMDEQSAMQAADELAAGLMADRSKGAQPTIFGSHNPLLKLFTQFQVEVNNEFSTIFKDIPKGTYLPPDKKKNLAAYTAWTLLRYFIGAYLFNDLYEKFVGRRAALDPLDLLNDAVSDFTGKKLNNVFDMLTEGVIEEQKRANPSDAVMNLGKNALEELPFIGGVLGGGRIPISSALPDAEKIVKGLANENWSGAKKAETVGRELGKSVVTYILPPFAGGLGKKLYQTGENAIRGGRYVKDAQGENQLQYPFYTDTPLETAGTLLQSAAFGPTATEGGREWVESGFNTLSTKKTKVYQMLQDDYGETQHTSYDLITGLDKILPQYDADGNGSYKQDEVAEALDNMTVPISPGEGAAQGLFGGSIEERYLTNEEKAVLWQAYNPKWKAANNPFDPGIGEAVQKKLTAKKEDEE